MDGWKTSNDGLTGLTSPTCCTIPEEALFSQYDSRKKNHYRAGLGRGDGSFWVVFLSFYSFFFLVFRSDLGMTPRWPLRNPPVWKESHERDQKRHKYQTSSALQPHLISKIGHLQMFFEKALGENERALMRTPARNRFNLCFPVDWS